MGMMSEDQGPNGPIQVRLRDFIGGLLLMVAATAALYGIVEGIKTLVG